MTPPVVTQHTPGSVFDRKTGQWYVPEGVPPAVAQVQAASTLSRLADAVSVVSALFMVGTFIGGIVLAATRNTNPTTGSTNHPHVLAGIGVVGLGLFLGVVAVMLASWARLYAVGVRNTFTEPVSGANDRG